MTAGFLSSDAKKTVEASNRSNDEYVKAWDIDILGPAIEAYNSPTPIASKITVPVPSSDRLVVEAGGYRVSVIAVRAKDIVRWPGIEDRTLFNLNVRRQLPKNRVRSALDRATTQEEEHARFLAAHNGITMICEKLETSDEKIVVHNPSVVNGAQSIIAFFDNRARLTDDLRIFAKICELDPAGPFAREIAIRSNTQSAVNSRNLRALDGPQLRLQQEFRKRFSDLTYETRPAAKLPKEGTVIQNDQAAKCLCAVMFRRPWLAIKSLSLFDEANYAAIFTDEIHAEQVLFSTKLKQLVDDDKGEYPAAYQGPWVLTSIIGTYLAAEALRAVRHKEDLISFAADYVSDPTKFQDNVRVAIRAARKTLQIRRDEADQNGASDEFKVDFKNEAVLKKLGREARKAAIYIQE